MREPVTDAIAGDFLQYFLDSFSRNESLFYSVRQARNKIREKYDREEVLPGSHWLPFIVRNSAIKLPIWNDFLDEFKFPSQIQFPLIIVSVLGLVSLFGSLLLEFNESNKYILYAQLYPHIVLYPSLFLGGCFYTLYKCICQFKFMRNRNIFRTLWNRFGSKVAWATAIALFLLSIELTSDNMMLFELKNNAVAIPQNISEEIVERIEQTPASVINVNSLLQGKSITIRKSDMELALENFLNKKQQLDNQQKLGYYELMKLSLSYGVWKGKYQMFSWSRWLYGLSFFLIVMTVCMTGIFWREIYSKEFFNKIRYLHYLVATQLILLIWIPLRLYYNIITKNLIFGNTLPVSRLDLFVYPVILLLAVTTIREIAKIDNPIPTIIMTIFMAFILPIWIGFYPQLVDIAFGLNSNPITWTIWIIFGVIFAYILRESQSRKL